MYYKPVHLGEFGYNYFSAIAAHCAGRQKGFDTIHRKLFGEESREVDWKGLAESTDRIDNTEYLSCIEDRATEEEVKKDERSSSKLGFRGVPYIIINGKGFLGALSYQQLETIVQQELHK
ncbi:DsbA family protein [Fodinibius halophilus]|uniref:Thioredoxin domain-containing protein n=1 Tax=Fodinibius halophilus TaxID=1736908 RepID=A0A6M1TJE3_9BACT|nr:thioredoxin domain-containing protein [Fodinibius halophilus]